MFLRSASSSPPPRRRRVGGRGDEHRVRLLLVEVYGSTNSTSAGSSGSLGHGGRRSAARERVAQLGGSWSRRAAAAAASCARAAAQLPLPAPPQLRLAPQPGTRRSSCMLTARPRRRSAMFGALGRCARRRCPPENGRRAVGPRRVPAEVKVRAQFSRARAIFGTRVRRSPLPSPWRRRCAAGRPDDRRARWWLLLRPGGASRTRRRRRGTTPTRRCGRRGRVERRSRRLLL